MEKIPKQVEEAILRGDKEALSAMGAKGNAHSQLIKGWNKERAVQAETEARFEQAQAYSVKDGEVLPPNTEEVAFLKDKLHK